MVQLIGNPRPQNFVMPEDLIKRLDPTLGSTKKIPQLVPVNRVRVEQSKDPVPCAV